MLQKELQTMTVEDFYVFATHTTKNCIVVFIFFFNDAFNFI